MNSEGWKLLTSELLDGEMFAALDAMFSQQLNNELFSLNYAYLKGQVDFIKSIYDVEVLVKGGDDEEQLEQQTKKLSDKIRTFYYWLTGAIRR